MIVTILLLLTSYLIGAFPIGYCIARLKGISDIRLHGSGNIGATNVARLLGFRYFFLILLLDAGKAYFFLIAVAMICSVQNLYFCATALLLGNSCSIFLRGSGGKGGATLCGILCAVQPVVVIPAFIVWLFSLGVTQTVGIASVCAAAIIPLYAYSMSYESYFFVWTLVLFLWILFLHRKNVRAYF